ncbi:MAG: 2-polyprenyl-3-methyl-6-methoxy-1,4-benzoquinone monooxygenase [Limnohabitans sp.]
MKHSTGFTIPSGFIDECLVVVDNGLRTVFARHHASRPYPAHGVNTVALNDAERKEAGALMRVNYVGEVCAQALYASQSLATRDPMLKAHFQSASAEETDHLAWTEARLADLGARPSLLNPLWYAGAFGLGYLAGKIGGDKLSLGFVVETERQVEAHLHDHLQRLPLADLASRAVVDQMKRDEAEHAAEAQKAGALPLPQAITKAMQLAAKVMTTVAHRI